METKELIEQELKEAQTEEKKLVLYNDDVNTFEHVIDCLVSICSHTENQAEQCAYIVHYKGKCIVKSGSFQKLKPIHAALSFNKLSVEIE